MDVERLAVLFIRADGGDAPCQPLMSQGMFGGFPDTLRVPTCGLSGSVGTVVNFYTLAVYFNQWLIPVRVIMLFYDSFNRRQ
ncbi:MAG: hypothetical protein L0332_29435 [Chloroflexi bacterium]|nr:hypothetical protein [Chloroflexota bacterium]MCI0647514.1 hypothetical protein [Chloroflexota bacterium]MCI0730825.1 hypothetical protein [Chloroflexota bacterium]